MRQGWTSAGERCRAIVLEGCRPGPIGGCQSLWQEARSACIAKAVTPGAEQVSEHQPSVPRTFEGCIASVNDRRKGMHRAMLYNAEEKLDAACSPYCLDRYTLAWPVTAPAAPRVAHVTDTFYYLQFWSCIEGHAASTATPMVDSLVHLPQSAVMANLFSSTNLPSSTSGGPGTVWLQRRCGVPP